MAKYIPTQCPKCGNDLCLTQPALKKGETESVAKGQRLLCMAEYKYVMHLNFKRQEISRW